MLKLHTYQLGTPRRRGEGLRIGVVRHLPRGVRKEDYARLNHFDVWFPNVAPCTELLHWVHEDQETRWTKFVERYTREMKQPDSRHAIELLAALAQQVRAVSGDDDEIETEASVSSSNGASGNRRAPLCSSRFRKC